MCEWCNDQSDALLDALKHDRSEHDQARLLELIERIRSAQEQGQA